MTASKLNPNEEKKKESVINVETCDDKIVEEKNDTETKSISNLKYYVIILIGFLILIAIGIGMLQIREQNRCVVDTYKQPQDGIIVDEVTNRFTVDNGPTGEYESFQTSEFLDEYPFILPFEKEMETRMRQIILEPEIDTSDEFPFH